MPSFYDSLHQLTPWNSLFYHIGPWRRAEEAGVSRLRIDPKNVAQPSDLEDFIEFLSTNTTLKSLDICKLDLTTQATGQESTNCRRVLQALFTHPTLSRLSIFDCLLTAEDALDVSRLLLLSSEKIVDVELQLMSLYNPPPLVTDTVNLSKSKALLRQPSTSQGLLELLISPWSAMVSRFAHKSDRTPTETADPKEVRKTARLHLEQLILSGIWLKRSEDDARVIFRALALAVFNHSSLVSLDLFNNEIPPLSALVLARVMEHSGKGRELKLGANFHLGVATSSGPSSLPRTSSASSVFVLSPFWKEKPFSSPQSMLTTLNLNDTAMTIECLLILLRGLNVSNTLQKLDVSYNRIELGPSHVADCRSLFAGLSSLTSLNLSNNSYFDPESYTAWLADSSVMLGLKELHVASCCLSDAFVSRLAVRLGVNQTLLSLNLSHNPISVVGISALTDAICQNKTLEKLDLSDTFLDDSCVRPITRMIQYNISLKSLSLYSINSIDSQATAGSLKGAQSSAAKPLTETSLASIAHITNYSNLSLIHLHLNRSKLGGEGSRGAPASIPGQTGQAGGQHHFATDHTALSASAIANYKLLDARLESNRQLLESRRSAADLSQTHWCNKDTMVFFRPPIFEDAPSTSPLATSKGSLAKGVSLATPSASPPITPRSQQPHYQKLLESDPLMDGKVTLSRTKSKIAKEILIISKAITSTSSPQNSLKLSDSIVANQKSSSSSSTYMARSLGDSGSHSSPTASSSASNSPTIGERPSANKIDSGSVLNVAHLSKLSMGLPFPCSRIGSDITRLSFVGLGMDHIPEGLFAACPPKLWYLDLRGNRIDRIPLNISDLSHLQFLLLSHNNLDSLPWTLLWLKNLKLLALQKNPLRLIPMHVRLASKYLEDSVDRPLAKSVLWHYLEEMHTTAYDGQSHLSVSGPLPPNAGASSMFSSTSSTKVQPTYHGRMMLLGDTGGGRSTLLQAFRDSFAKSNKDSSSSSKKRNSSKRKSANKPHLKESSGSQPDAFSVNMSYLNMTYDVKDDPKAPNASSKGYSAKPVPQTQTNISWICYDFADQSLEAAHNLFMSEDMVYLIVFNAAHFSKERLSTLELWIRTIQDRCHHPFIYLIGTHLDQVEQSKVPLLQSLRTHWPELGPKPWFDAFFVDASTTSSSAKLPSFANQLTNCVQMKTLICELARRCLQERRCIKDWLPSLAAISSLISSVAYSDQLLPTTPNTRHSIDEKSSPPDRNATKPIQNFMTFSAITSLIYHYGIPDTNIMRIIAALEENGTLLYFGRRELNVQSISLSSSAPHSSVSGSLIASPTSLLSNLAVINPEFCCQLLSQLGLLRNIVSRSGLISLAESRDLFTKMGIKTNDRISGASSSKQSPSLGTSTPSNSSTSLILQIEQFWALLEVVQIAIKVVAPSTTFGAQQRANMIRASDDSAPPNMHPTLAPVYRVNPTYRSSAELALQLNAMDEDAKAALEAKARRQESANLKNRDHVIAPSPDASPRAPSASSSQLGFKTASSSNSSLPSLENPSQPDTFYFVPSLLPTRPTTTWNRFFKFLPTDSLKLHSARHGVSIEAAENSEHLNWYRRWYRFERIPIGIFGKLIASSMQIPGSEITNPWSRGFEVHLDKEHAQIYFLTPQDLFLDVIGYPSGALLFSLAHTIADVVAGWYHMRDAKDAVSEWVAYRVPTDGTFLYEDVDVIMDAIKNGQSSCIISRRSELGVLQSPKGVQTAFDDLPSSQISIISSKNAKAQVTESPKALGNAFGEGLLTALATPAAAPATGGVEVQLMNIVPDKINKRWEENHIDPSELYMISKVPVGKGGFASVYLAHYKGFKVAVKRIDAAVFANFEQTVAVEEEDNSTEEVVEIEALPDPKTKDRTVSLKKLSPEDRRRRQLLAVLELNHEVRIMYALGKHPNLCSMHGFLFSPPQLVLERLECGDLLSCVYSEASKATPSNPWYREGLSFSSESTLKSSSSSHGIPTDIPLPKNALSWTSSLRVLLDVARALAHMHSAGIVHRDLALNNVMLHNMDAPLDLSIPMAKVIDFGLAAQLVGGQTGQFHNEKWAILAPEVLSGRPFTASSEVYSFSIMMYQLYTRCLLTFTGEHAIKQGKRPKIPDLPPFPIKISSSAEQMESIKQDLARLKKSLENEIMMAEQDSTSQPGTSQKSRSSGSAESSRRTSTMPNATITPFSRYESLVRFVELMGECWAHDPQRRPDFPQVARKMALIWFLFTGISPVV